MTWTSAFGRACGWLLDRIVHTLALTRISPNVLTFVGLMINIAAAFFFGHANAPTPADVRLRRPGDHRRRHLRHGRRPCCAPTNQVTIFGAFFDSVIDRYSDVVLFFGLLVYYARVNHFRYVVLTAFVMVTSLMVSYTRARAEALIGSCKVGFMERPERIVLVILGALFNHWGVMAPVLWVLAVLSTITVVHRIQYTYWNTKHLAPLNS